jgi:hypothetical protein
MEMHLLILANGKLHPITPTGKFTLDRLRLNRRELVEYRRRRRFGEEEADVLVQHRELLESLKRLQQQFKEAVEEHKDLLREQRAALARMLDGNGRVGGTGPTPS